MLHGFFYSAQLSHLFSSVCVCSCREWFNTETAGKEAAQAGKPEPSEWLLHTRVSKHSAWEHVQMQVLHTTVGSVFRILWGNNYMLGRCSPSGMRGRSQTLIHLVLPGRYCLSFWLCSMAKTSRSPGESVKKEQVLLTLLAAKNCQFTFHLYFQQLFSL